MRRKTKDSFWKTEKLEDLTPAQWENLCDGCGRCCLNKIFDPDTDTVFYTSVACRLLDIGSCRCRQYDRRKQLVPDCLSLRGRLRTLLSQLPTTCAYRLVCEGYDLPSWHPLISGDPESVHEAGISVRGKAIPESTVDEQNLDAYVFDFE
jgi:uncharacterized cysteine cluster protein YcgN (CxxCxxCC family)